MTEWTQKHPIATHLINLAITVLIITGSAFALKYMYGDKIDAVYDNTKVIMEVVINL